ncbi:MAG: hypothetical protein L0338_13885, partial [Acidobacteria bacterium]|nr:hypothetical protein [Acidobacteriota bacterium]
MPHPDPPNRLGRTRLIGLLVVGLGLWTLPVPVTPPSPGLDSSWRIALVIAVENGWHFGEQILWTYGPLGFLDSSLYANHKLWLVSLVFNNAVHFLFVAVFFMVLAELRPQAVLARA